MIGLGVGQAHVTAYQSHPACEVVALCDRSKAKLSRARADRDRLKICSTGSTGQIGSTGSTNTDVELFDNAGDLLRDANIDVVSIASYDNDHYEQIVQALENDKHVFVEKPLCHRAEEARHIRALLTEKPHLRLSSNLILRQCPRFIALKERISRGAMGELFLVEGDYHYGRLHKITAGWRGAIDFYSVVHGGAIHMVDLLLWLTGERITEVAAFGNRIASRGSQFRYNDTVVSALTFESGLVGKVGVSFGCVRPHFHGLSIYGTRATFVNAVPHGLLYESCDTQVPPTPMTEPYPGVHKGGLIGSFIDSILYGCDPIVNENDVFAAMSVCLAIEKAIATGKSCSVSYL